MAGVIKFLPVPLTLQKKSSLPTVALSASGSSGETKKSTVLAWICNLHMGHSVGMEIASNGDREVYEIPLFFVVFLFNYF